MSREARSPVRSVRSSSQARDCSPGNPGMRIHARTLTRHSFEVSAVLVQPNALKSEPETVNAWQFVRLADREALDKAILPVIGENARPAVIRSKTLPVVPRIQTLRSEPRAPQPLAPSRRVSTFPLKGGASKTTFLKVFRIEGMAAYNAIAEGDVKAPAFLLSKSEQQPSENLTKVFPDCRVLDYGHVVAISRRDSTAVPLVSLSVYPRQVQSLRARALHLDIPLYSFDQSDDRQALRNKSLACRLDSSQDTGIFNIEVRSCEPGIYRLARPADRSSGVYTLDPPQVAHSPKGTALPAYLSRTSVRPGQFMRTSSEGTSNIALAHEGRGAAGLSAIQSRQPPSLPSGSRWSRALAYFQSGQPATISTDTRRGGHPRRRQSTDQ